MLSIELNEPLPNFLCLTGEKGTLVRQLEPVENMNIFQSLSVTLEKQTIPLKHLPNTI